MRTNRRNTLVLLLLAFAASALFAAWTGCVDHEKDPREMNATIIHGAPVTAVAFSPDARTLASAGLDDMIRMIDVTDYHLDFDSPSQVTALPSELMSSPLIGYGTGFESLAFTPDGATVLGGTFRLTSGGAIGMWSVETGEPVGELTVSQTGPVVALAFHPDGELLASGAGYPFETGRADLWNLDSGYSVFTDWPGHSRVNAVAFSADGTLFATASDDGAVRLWRTDDQVLVRELGARDHVPHAVAFSPDGERIASGGDDSGPGFGAHGGLVRIWDLDSGDLELTMDLSTMPIRAIDYSPDGTMLAVAGDAHQIKLVDPWTSEQIISLKGHSQAINSVRFSSNGQLLASGSDDQYVRIWYVGDLVGRTCDDGIDNDLDGWLDAEDPDCADGDRETGFGDTECNDNDDNDDDGYIDSNDPECDDAFDDSEEGATDGGVDGGVDGGADAGVVDGGADGGL